MNRLENYPLSTVLCFLFFSLLGLYALRSRKVSGSNYFIGAMLLVAFDAFASLGELASVSLHSKLWWRNIQQVPLFISPLCFLGVVWSLTNVEQRVMKRRLRWLSIPILVYLLLIFSDSYHHLMRVSVNLEPYDSLMRVRVQSTGLSKLFILYSKIIGVSLPLLLAWNLGKVSSYYKRQYGIVIASLVAPYFILYPLHYMGLQVSVALSTVPSALGLFYALYRYKLLRVRPLARERVFEVIQDAIVVLDPGGVVIDANPAGFQFLGRLSAEKEDKERYIGKPIVKFLQSRPDLLQFWQEGGTGFFELSSSYYSVQLSPIRTTRTKSSALLIFRDQTERHLYEKELIKRATLDELTEVFNRSHFLEQTAQVFQEHPNVSLLVLDIDCFKTINDRFGHQTGDLVLNAFGRLLREAVPPRGIVGRLGGEEFAVLLPGCSAAETQTIAEKIRNYVETSSIRGADKDMIIRITVSIGVVTKKTQKDTFKELYNRADQALYVSKNSGRNKVTVA